MSDLVERLREEADYTHKHFYRVASDEQREQCRALTLEAADRIAALEAALRTVAEIVFSDSVEYDDLRNAQHVIDTVLPQSEPPVSTLCG